MAAKLADEQSPANIDLKLNAIRYLAEQDCLCYPELVDALLTSLDDCAEPVRYEALRALRKGCSACKVCRCQARIISRLSDLLLDRAVDGRVKERSIRVRRLAQLIIQDCLGTTPVMAAPALASFRHR